MVDLKVEPRNFVPLDTVMKGFPSICLPSQFVFIRCFDIVNENLYFVVNKPCDMLKQIT